MTGRWQEYEDKCCHWYFNIKDDDKIWFRDPRCFATIEFTSNYSDFKKY